MAPHHASIDFSRAYTVFLTGRSDPMEIRSARARKATRPSVAGSDQVTYEAAIALSNGSMAFIRDCKEVSLL